MSTRVNPQDCTISKSESYSLQSQYHRGCWLIHYTPVWARKPGSDGPSLTVRVLQHDFSGEPDQYQLEASYYGETLYFMFPDEWKAQRQVALEHDDEQNFMEKWTETHKSAWGDLGPHFQGMIDVWKALNLFVKFSIIT